MTNQDSKGAITREVIARCKELGFLLAGVCAARETERERELREWIGAGKHGEMQYLAREVEKLADVRRVLAGAKSVICVADRYPAWLNHTELGKFADEEHGLSLAEPREQAVAPRQDSTAMGKVARYARGRDYHVVMKKRLEILCKEMREQFPGEGFKVCVDTSPVMEREHAARAGIGRVGKHTLVIGEGGVGSWILLGEIVTTLELCGNEEEEDGGIRHASINPAGNKEEDGGFRKASTHPTKTREDEDANGGVRGASIGNEEELDSRLRGNNDRSDPCGSCTRCIDACPTGAITPWSVDARRCISYLTIEHRSEIDAELAERMEEWVFGCDVCQEVCPHNQQTARSERVGWNEAYEPRVEGFDLLEVLGWDEGKRREAFTQAAMKRAKLWMMKRNAVIAAGNVLREREDVGLRGRLEEISQDEREEEMVREAAREVIGRTAKVRAQEMK